MAISVHAAALRLLQRRALSAKELEERLVARGFGAEVVVAELERLRRSGLLDDLELARSLCRVRLERGYGKRYVEVTLLRRRLDPEAVDTVLREIGDDESEGALREARRRAGRRFPAYRSLPATRDKVVRYLLARGFGASEIFRALGRDDGEDHDAGEDLE